MSLRKLVWAANAKREHDYDISIATIQYLACSMNGDKVGSVENPYRNVDRIKSETELKEEAKQGMERLKSGLSHIAKGRG